jgi:hypothetical protein
MWKWKDEIYISEYKMKSKTLNVIKSTIIYVKNMLLTLNVIKFWKKEEHFVYWMGEWRLKPWKGNGNFLHNSFLFIFKFFKSFKFIIVLVFNCYLYVCFGFIYMFVTVSATTTEPILWWYEVEENLMFNCFVWCFGIT